MDTSLVNIQITASRTEWMESMDEGSQFSSPSHSRQNWPPNTLVSGKSRILKLQRLYMCWSFLPTQGHSQRYCFFFLSGSSGAERTRRYCLSGFALAKSISNETGNRRLSKSWFCVFIWEEQFHQ